MKALQFVVAISLLVASSLPGLAKARTVLSLDGTWDLAEGNMEKAPAHFDHRIAVPGLVDSAQPSFSDVGKSGPNLRQAFWYRRTFQIKGTVPAIALLKVHKAAYGSAVWVNGTQLGEHLPSFTPGYFDAHSVLRGEGQTNEIIIRVGADRTQVPKSIPSGWDFEKIRYIPGLFDSVELILSGTPNIVRLQVAPDITNQNVRVQTVLRNAGAGTTAQVHFQIREARSHKVVGETNAAVSLGTGAEQTVDLRIPLRRCRLWSPEDPFLYELVATTDTDEFSTRFGMRDFRFDPATGRAMLNGKPYFLRGSNVTLYRFFEDPLCGNRPWDEAWVRRLHRTFKTMHWNSLRYCIGFPPEFWYRIADEEGILIQDEFPIWHLGAQNWPAELKPPQLVTEYTEWMQERWNHPCVVIWDAQNETSTTETAKAVRAVRGLDLSNRPWDNGWGEPGEPGDVYESHPYLSNNEHFVLEDLQRISGVPKGSPRDNSTKNPIIINEYGWLWLNRDGSPTTLSRKAYENLLGTNATPAQRWHTYARYLAAKTEFWRSHRACAGVLHFCGLGYSRPDGQTCDNFIDLKKLKYEPEFERYVGDAFAPVGLMIDEWSEQLQTGKVHTFPVVAINDLERPWKGQIRFRIIRDAKTVQEKSLPCDIAAWGKTKLEFPVTLPSQPGAYQFQAALVRGFSKPVCSVRDIALVTTITNRCDSLAKGKAVRASSSYSENGTRYVPENAVDASKRTRWSSEFSDPQWLAVDLGESKQISRVKLLWEAARARAYSVEVSDDGSSWTKVFSTKQGKGVTDDVRFTPTKARWVRLNCTQRTTKFGYSLWEVLIYE